MTDPETLIKDMEDRTSDLMRRAEATKEQIATLAGTATSEDRAVTITVNATGALQNVAFGPNADKLPKDRLATLIMATARQAQATAARQVTEIMTPLIGADSEAMHMLTDQLPDTEPPPPPTAPRQAPIYNEDRQPVAPEPPAAPPRQPRRPLPDDEVEHDYDQHTVLKKKRR